MISLPFCDVKLEINIFRGWDTIPPLAYVFIKSSMWFSLTKVFLKIGWKLGILALNFWGTSIFGIERSQISFRFLIPFIIAQLQVNVCKECFLGYVFWHYRWSCRVSTVHTPTFQWQWGLFLVYSFVSIHRALSS